MILIGIVMSAELNMVLKVGLSIALNAILIYVIIALAKLKNKIIFLLI